MDAIELTQALVRLESMNPGGSEHACAHYLGDLLGANGFSIRYHEFAPGRTWDLWHDRAVFHFLVEDDEREAYRAAAERAVSASGKLVIAR